MEIIAHQNCQYLFQALLAHVYPVLNILALAAAEGPRAESDSKNQEAQLDLKCVSSRTCRSQLIGSKVTPTQDLLSLTLLQVIGSRIGN